MPASSSSSIVAVPFVLAGAACSAHVPEDGDDDGGVFGGSRETVCLDGAGEPAASCAVEPSEEVCPTGDANECAVVVREEIWADDGENGPCFFLVIDNACDETLYTVVCTEHARPGEEPGWQCWWSTTLGGAQIDVSQCHATGRYRHVSTLESGKLDLLAEKCDYGP